MHLFIHWRQLKISHFFIAQAYFKVSKDIKLISTLYYILKIQIRGNFSKWHIIIQDFEKICSPWTKGPYPFQLLILFCFVTILYDKIKIQKCWVILHNIKRTTRFEENTYLTKKSNLKKHSTTLRELQQLFLEQFLIL